MAKIKCKIFAQFSVRPNGASPSRQTLVVGRMPGERTFDGQPVALTVEEAFEVHDSIDCSIY